MIEQQSQRSASPTGLALYHSGEEMTMTITAKFRGTCTKCGNTINAGETIEWTRGSGAAHVTCSAATTTAPRMLHCRCGNTGRAGAYPFSTLVSSGRCDDCV